MYKIIYTVHGPGLAFRFKFLVDVTAFLEF